MDEWVPPEAKTITLRETIARMRDALRRSREQAHENLDAFYDARERDLEMQIKAMGDQFAEATLQ